MKISFLFWNLCRSAKPHLMAALTRLAGRADVMLFAEPPEDSASVLAALKAGDTGFQRISAAGQRVHFYHRLQGANWIDRFSGDPGLRFTAMELQPDGALSLLIIGAHLVAPNHSSPKGRAERARGVAHEIRLLEKDAGHQRTVLVGDLNMNPFDDGLVETTALHAVMTRRLAASVSELKARKPYTPFYNPMWSLLGDRSAGPPGTFFYTDTGAMDSHFWQMYDQVLIRPEIMHNLAHVEVLDSDGEQSLLTAEGRPRDGVLSDHLPIRFDLVF